MKVLHLNSEKSWRGGEQQMTYLAAELKSRGISSVLAFPAQNNRLKAYSKDHNFEWVDIPFGGLQVMAILKLFFLLKKNKIDIIHTHTAKAHTVAVWANILGAKTSLVVSKRTDFEVKSIYKFQHKSVKAILCVSKMIEKITKAPLNTKTKKIVSTVHSGVDLNRFNSIEQMSLKDKYQIGTNKVLIGNCSAIADQKDYFTFIDTAQILITTFPDKFHFVIIGDGPDREKIENYCQSKKLQDDFTFTGFLPKIELYLKSLDLFLMSSKTEGLGTSLLDAMLCEIPIVSTNAGGIPEIVIHEKTGLIANIKDANTLAKNIIRLLEDDILRKELISNAKKQVVQDYSKEHTCEKTLAIYKNIFLE